MEIYIKYHNPDLRKVSPIDIGNWIDLRSAENVTMEAGEFRLISLGVSMKLPKGYEAWVTPRSSTYKTWGIIQANSVGVIDNSYSGTNDIWHFSAIALRKTVIRVNDRICQFRVMPIMGGAEFIERDELDSTDRGGIGSTGTC